MLPHYHYAKVIQNIYDVTGNNLGRSERQEQERYLEQHNNETNYFDMKAFFAPVGYSQDYGFPQRNLTHGVPLYGGPAIPLTWTITTRNP
jgi:hypothetical protein